MLGTSISGHILFVRTVDIPPCTSEHALLERAVLSAPSNSTTRPASTTFESILSARSRTPCAANNAIGKRATHKPMSTERERDDAVYSLSDYCCVDYCRRPVKHDGMCEYGKVSMYSNTYRITCYCAQRAYARDPIPDLPLPNDVTTSDYQSGNADDWDYPT